MTQETADTTETQTSETTAEVVETPAVVETTEDTILGEATETTETVETPEAAAEANLEGLPDKYELTAGEGFEIDATVLEEATPIFKELGLGQEQAQQLVPLGEKLISQYEAAKADEFAAIRAEWAREVKEDAEIGKGNFAETQRLCGKALDVFTGPQFVMGEDGKPLLNEDGKPVPSEFRQFLNETGIGNHPVFVKVFREIGSAISEEYIAARGQTNPAVPKSREELLYPEDVRKAGNA